jgi:hypothetical protein
LLAGELIFTHLKINELSLNIKKPEIQNNRTPLKHLALTPVLYVPSPPPSGPNKLVPSATNKKPAAKLRVQ